MSTRAEVEVSVTMRPTAGGQARSAVTRACPVVVPTAPDSRDDVVATVLTAQASLADAAHLVVEDLAQTIAHLLVADPPEPARHRDVGLAPHLAMRIKNLYGQRAPLDAVKLDLLPLGSVVEQVGGRHPGRQWRQEGYFSQTHERLGTTEISAWRQVPVPGLPPVLRVRRADELALMARLRLVHAPGAPDPRPTTEQERGETR